MLRKREITGQKFRSEQLRRLQRQQAVGRRAGQVAHDLGNMLGVIMGYTELALQSEATPAPLREDLRDVQKAAQHALELTGQLLISPDSRPAQGTTFTTCLPRAPGEATSPKSPVAATPGGSPDCATILLVEDEEAVLGLCRKFLARQCCTVLTAATVGQALELATTYPGPLHLLITDLVMPEMNGKELMEKISALRPGIKTIMMSGYSAEVINQQELLAAGVNFIGKPFAEREFNQLVRETLALGRDGGGLSGGLATSAAKGEGPHG